MKEEKLSGGYCVVGQVMILIFIGIIVLLLATLSFRGFALDKFLFFAGVSFFAFLIIKNTLDFNDITILNENDFIINNLFHRKKISLDRIIVIKPGILPFTYFVMSEKKSYYFFLDLKYIFKETFSMSPNSALNILNDRLLQLQSNKHKSNNT